MKKLINTNNMKRKILASLVAVAVVLPTILLMAESKGMPNVYNFIGLAWLAFLAIGGGKLLTPKWVRDELYAMFPEEESETD